MNNQRLSEDKMKKTLLFLVAFLVLSGLLFSETKSIQLSLFNPVQLHDESVDIRGLRLNLYGKNRSLSGIDLGIFNHLDKGNSSGVQWGFVNMVSGSYYGLQISEGINYTIDMEGVQWGMANYSKKMKGLQLGLINYAETLRGVQLGLLNIINSEGFLPVCIIFNFGNL